MQLRSAPASPFARKIRIAIDVAGLSDRVEILATDTSKPDGTFFADNPLAKIPTLVLGSGETLYDSRVIAAYLDEMAGGGVLLPHGPDRFKAMTFEALADGIMDAIVLQVYERRWRAEDRRDAAWVAHQASKVSRGLAEAGRLLGTWQIGSTAIHIGHISLASGLGYLDLRFDGTWRTEHPVLVPWLDDFAARVRAFERTQVRPA